MAGLAAYLWTIKPGLTPAQITEILVRTADSTDCGGTNPRPLIDAYAAVLALDRNYPDMEVRRAILDLNEDRVFNETDVEKFLAEFDTANGAKDYSRYDLNGDGQTGGTETRIFNLDMDFPPTYNTVTQAIEGNSVSFDENNLTDLNILCYYAYSRLYTGDTDKRRDLLAEKCGGALDVTYAEAYTTSVYCDDIQNLGTDGGFNTSVSLPIHLAASCGGGSSDMTVQNIGPNHIAMDLSASFVLTQNPPDTTWYGASTREYAEGRIISGTYTVEMSPVFTGYGVGLYIFSLSVPGGGSPYFERRCQLTAGDPSGCSVPVSFDIVIPEHATHHWDYGMHFSGPHTFTLLPGTVSGRVFSIKPK